MGQIFQLGQVVDRHHTVGHAVQGLRALRQRGIALKAQQRIEPQNPPRVQLQPSQFLRQGLRLSGVQAIGDDQNQGSPPDQLARMVPAQAFQGLTELGSARKIFD